MYNIFNWVQHSTNSIQHEQFNSHAKLRFKKKTNIQQMDNKFFYVWGNVRSHYYLGKKVHLMRTLCSAPRGAHLLFNNNWARLLKYNVAMTVSSVLSTTSLLPFQPKPVPIYRVQKCDVIKYSFLHFSILQTILQENIIKTLTHHIPN